MEKVVFQTISSADEIDLFLEKFKDYVGVKIPPVYAEKNKVVGAFLRNKLVGGYMLITEPPFRSLAFVPDTVKANHNLFAQDQYEMVEVNALWISPAVKSAQQNFEIWMHVIKDIFLSRKRFVLLMSDPKNKNIQKIHRLTGAKKVYEGRSELIPGNSSLEEISLCYSTRWKFILSFHRYWRAYRRRTKKIEAKLSIRRQQRGASRLDLTQGNLAEVPRP